MKPCGASGGQTEKGNSNSHPAGIRVLPNTRDNTSCGLRLLADRPENCSNFERIPLVPIEFYFPATKNRGNIGRHYNIKCISSNNFGNICFQAEKYRPVCSAIYACDPFPFSTPPVNPRRVSIEESRWTFLSWQPLVSLADVNFSSWRFHLALHIQGTKNIHFSPTAKLLLRGSNFISPTYFAASTIKKKKGDPLSSTNLKRRTA